MEKVIIKKPHRGTENLIPLNRRTKEERFKIQSMGGKACKNNPNSSLGQKLRFLKEKGFTDKTKERLFELLQNPAFSRMDYLNFLENVRMDKNMDTETKLRVLAAIKESSKLIHGTKEYDSKHAVTVVHLTPEEKLEEINRLLS